MIPTGSAGTSVLLQGAALGPATANGVFATTDAHLIAMGIAGGPLGSVPGPTSDDQVVVVDVVTPGWCPQGVPFYGTTYQELNVSSNGRVLFGGADPTFAASISAGQSGFPFVGNWTDINPAAGGSITISAPGPEVVRVDFTNVPYWLSSDLVSFGIEFDAGCGDVTLDGLSGISDNSAAFNALTDTFLGISPGGSAASPGITPSRSGAFGLSAAANAMLYDFDASNRTASAASGIETIRFERTAIGNYHWSAN